MGSLILFDLRCHFQNERIKTIFTWMVGCFIHDTSDLFNSWGTGYLEPFSNNRITFGTIPIIDFVFWIIMGIAFILSKKNKQKSPYYFKMAWALLP